VAKEKFADFVSATSAWAGVAQETIELRRVSAHEFAHRPEPEGLLATLRPFVYPFARDIGDVVHLLASETSSKVTVTADGLDHVDRRGGPPWSTGQSWATDFA
jgi:hypothetical protein